MLQLLECLLGGAGLGPEPHRPLPLAYDEPPPLTREIASALRVGFCVGGGVGSGLGGRQERSEVRDQEDRREELEKNGRRSLKNVLKTIYVQYFHA